MEYCVVINLYLRLEKKDTCLYLVEYCFSNDKTALKKSAYSILYLYFNIRIFNFQPDFKLIPITTKTIEVKDVQLRHWSTESIADF